jgi:hypothetical protein
MQRANARSIDAIRDARGGIRSRIGVAMAPRITAISVNAENNPDVANGARIRAPRWLHPGYRLAGWHRCSGGNVSRRDQ